MKATQPQSSWDYERRTAAASRRWSSATVDYSRAIVTRGPTHTHDPRYQVGPGEAVPPIFSALPLGSTLTGGGA